MSELRKAIIRVVEDTVKPGMFTGTVTQITGQTCTVQPDDGGPVHYKVRMKAKIDGKDFGIIITPTIGSAVVVGMIGKNANNLMIVAWSQCDNILIKQTGQTRIQFRKSGVLELNGTNLGGLVKVQALLAKLNAIESKLNELIAVYTIHSHPSNGSPPAGAPVTSISPTVISDIENLKVKQGG